MNSLINLVVGDWSHDGHGITDTTLIRSNRNYDDLIKAYKAGCEIVGFELDNICRSYDDGELPVDNAEMLRDAGFDLNTLEGYEGVDEAIYITSEDFTIIYLAICQMGDPKFLYEYVTAYPIHIGGYGLFYD